MPIIIFRVYICWVRQAQYPAAHEKMRWCWRLLQTLSQHIGKGPRVQDHFHFSDSCHYSHLLVDFIILSNKPPHHGAFSRLKDHCIPVFALQPCTTESLNMSDMPFAVALKVFPLSEIILCESPLLAVKRLKHWMKLSAVRSGTISRWTALMTQHVNKQIQTFS